MLTDDEKRLLLDTAYAVLVNRPGLFEQFDNDLRYSRWSLFFNAIDIAQFKNSHMEKARINNAFHFDARLTSEPAAVAAALVARWAAHQPTPYFPEALRALPSPTHAATASATPQPQTAPESASETPLPMAKAALITAHKQEWPTIERDIADATSNGLAGAAKAGARGWWEQRAIEWARAKGKLKSADRPVDSLAQGVNSMFNLPGRKYTL